MISSQFHWEVVGKRLSVSAPGLSEQMTSSPCTSSIRPSFPISTHQRSWGTEGRARTEIAEKKTRMPISRCSAIYLFQIVSQSSKEVRKFTHAKVLILAIIRFFFFFIAVVESPPHSFRVLDSNPGSSVDFSERSLRSRDVSQVCPTFQKHVPLSCPGDVNIFPIYRRSAFRVERV